ncbi:uncharacterized protein TNCV_4449461 [Trichonephila clavipes]|nr:uncharacterized protein TNCV_4449461 [Trichonephila clavipes]
MLRDAREFADEIDIPANFELTQPRHRVRRRKVNFDYEAREDPIEDPTLKYKTEFYFFTLDKAINALESRNLFHKLKELGMTSNVVGSWIPKTNVALDKKLKSGSNCYL